MKVKEEREEAVEANITRAPLLFHDLPLDEGKGDLAAG